MMSQKTTQKWLDLTKNKNHVWTKKEINAYRKHITRLTYKKQMTDAENMINGLCDGGLERKITKEQSDFGLQYLLQNIFKKNGEKRGSAFARCFGDREVKILKKFKKFSFVGLDLRTNGLGDIYWTSPIYRVHAKNGDYFDYTAGHWELPQVLN